MDLVFTVKLLAIPEAIQFWLSRQSQVYKEVVRNQKRKLGINKTKDTLVPSAARDFRV